MNFLYYKNFGDDKPSTSHTTYKKKKDPRKSKGNYGNDCHGGSCDCDLCTNEYPLRTHLLLDMSYSRLDPEVHSTSRKSTASSMFHFFHFGKKASTLSQAGREERPLVRVTFSSNEGADQPHLKGSTPPLEPVSLSTLKQDCFMIPVRRLFNFFPAGHPIPTSDSANLRMIETAEPDFKIMFHMMGPAEPFQESLSSPLVNLHTYQKECAIKAFKSAVTGINVGSALQGMVLLNLEKEGEFGAVEYPFMIVWVIDRKKCDYSTVAAKARQFTLEALDPVKTGYKSTHYIDTFEEVAMLARPPIDKLCRRASTSMTGYIISVFKVFEGDDGVKFERNWLGWSGARALYKSMSTEVGLRRLTLHKSGAQDGILHYILLVDCSNFLSCLASAVQEVPKLRMRRCGDTGLYRPICTV